MKWTPNKGTTFVALIRLDNDELMVQGGCECGVVLQRAWDSLCLPTCLSLNLFPLLTVVYCKTKLLQVRRDCAQIIRNGKRDPYNTAQYSFIRALHAFLLHVGR